MRKVLVMLMVMALAMTAGAAFALDSTTITVTATVVGGCQITTAPTTTAIDFASAGTVDGSTDLTVNDSLGFTCTNGTGYTVDIGGNSGAAGSSWNFSMTDTTTPANPALGYSVTQTPISTGTAGAAEITFGYAVTLTGAEILANGIAGDQYDGSFTININP